MIIVNGTVCNKCVMHVDEIRRQQKRISQLLSDNCTMMDGFNALQDGDNSDNVWFYIDGEDNFVESLNDGVSVIMDAKTLKKILKR